MLDRADSGSTGGAGGNKRRRSLRGQVGHTGARFGSPALRRTLETGQTGEEQPEELPVPAPRTRSKVGRTGARFGSPALRRDLETEEDTEVVRPPDIEQTAPFSGHFDEPEPVPEPEYYEEDRHSLVRPYAWTGGRTSSSYDLRLETLVSVEESGIPAAMRSTSPEQRSIVEMCALPRSVAEVSAMLSVPLGVARVLLGDLIGMGIVAVHDSGGTAGARPDFVMLERVLAGLRRL
jgi:hypothetical protein